MVDTPAGKVAYSDTGDGPVVVLLHATLHDRHDFDAIAPSLCRDHRVIAVDWPGHGDSPAPAPDYRPTAASFADVLVDVVTALDLPPAAFIGNSVGGFAAARLAITDPDRVSRLVLVNSGGFVAGPASNFYARLLGRPAVMKRILPRFIPSYMKAASDNDRAIEERELTRARTRDGVAIAASMWRSFASPEHNLRPQAERITVPCLVVWGSKDTAIPMRLGRATAAAIPGARLESLPTGHVPFSSDPDGFLAIVAPFLADVSERQP
ncbi:alpha/beta fold hydrolase [Mycobacterium sp. 134]|uniref:alpha/beta fold hydrolase n=1 Tax=Mycobacterium sp. 134 TaxID=3400425 RepID=UPI003AAED839